MKVKGCKIRYYVNSNQKRAWVVIITSDAIDFKSKIVTRDKERHHIFKKASLHREDVTNIIRASKQRPKIYETKMDKNEEK